MRSFVIPFIPLGLYNSYVLYNPSADSILVDIIYRGQTGQKSFLTIEIGGNLQYVTDQIPAGTTAIEIHGDVLPAAFNSIYKKVLDEDGKEKTELQSFQSLPVYKVDDLKKN